MLKPLDVKITRIASGVPVGGDIVYIYPVDDQKLAGQSQEPVNGSYSSRQNTPKIVRRKS
jgi:hypothetical protein